MKEETKVVIGAILVTLILMALLCFFAMQLDNELTEGTVIKKIHENRTMRWTGKFWMVDDEDWYVTVNGINQKGQEITENWEVTKQEYNAIEIGDWLTRSEE